jgi:hypothetical protein
MGHCVYAQISGFSLLRVVLCAKRVVLCAKPPEAGWLLSRQVSSPGLVRATEYMLAQANRLQQAATQLRSDLVVEVGGEHSLMPMLGKLRANVNEVLMQPPPLPLLHRCIMPIDKVLIRVRSEPNLAAAPATLQTTQPTPLPRHLGAQGTRVRGRRHDLHAHQLYQCIPRLG